MVRIGRLLVHAMFVGGLLGYGALGGKAEAALIGVFSDPNECGGQGGFGNCFATQSGTQQGAPTDPGLLASPSVYKRDASGNAPTGPQAFGSFYPSVDGTEFSITYDSTGNVLAFTYTPGTDDPELHYFLVKQASGFALFYDASAITAGTVDLDTYFPNNPGWSHITFFNSGSSQVPEPATLGLLGAALAALTFARRKPRKG